MNGRSSGTINESPSKKVCLSAYLQKALHKITVRLGSLKLLIPINSTAPPHQPRSDPPSAMLERILEKMKLLKNEHQIRIFLIHFSILAFYFLEEN